MSWEKLKEMNLYDKLEDHLKTVPTKDSKAVEGVIIDTDSLQRIKACIHDGMDSRSISEAMGLSIQQVDIIKDIIGQM